MKKLTCLLLALCMLLGCVCVQAEGDQAARYQQGMQLIAQGKYTEAYDVFMGLAGYEDADAKAYALGFTKIATLEKLSDTSAIIRYKDVFGMVDFSTNTVTPPQWTESKKVGDNRLAVKKGDLWGIIDGTGKTIFTEQWWDISSANNGVCVTYYNGLYGLINVDGTELLKCEWKQIGSSVYTEGKGYEIYSPNFHKGLIRVQNASGLWGFVNRKGEAVVAPQYAYAEEYDTQKEQATVVTLTGYLTVIDTKGVDMYFTNPTYFATQYQTAYANAVALRDQGKYDEAVTAFTNLGVYSDAATQAKATYYAKGEALLAKSDYDGAIKAFQSAGDYTDAGTRVKATYYAKGEALLARNDYDGAVTAFKSAGDYTDAATRVKATYYAKGLSLESVGKKDDARTAFLAAGDYQDAAAKAKANLVIKAGNYITYGHYPQTKAGTDNTPIEWLVLKVEGNKALVISRYGLDAHRFDASKYQGWDKSEIRTWLNSTFLNKAFTAFEQASIVATIISTPKYSGYSGGADTQDKIWLLSRDEATTYFKMDSARKTTPTPYAVARGAYQYSGTDSKYKLDGTGCCWWWLRSPGFSSDYASDVDSFGGLINLSVDYASNVVRPAFFLNLDSAILY